MMLTSGASPSTVNDDFRSAANADGGLTAVDEVLTFRATEAVYIESILFNSNHDGVQTGGAVPLPASCLLLRAALGGLGMARRRAA